MVRLSRVVACMVAAVSSAVGVVVFDDTSPAGADPAVGTISTAVSGLTAPGNIAFDGSGRLLIADTYAHRIRRWNPSTGTLQTVAGTGIAGFTGDNGPPRRRG